MRNASNSNTVPDSVKPLAVTVRTAAKILGVGNTTMWGLVKSGRVKTVTIGRRRLVIYASIETLLAADAGAAS
jgi:excisionase family DNA binding protein